ncbi:hypothetical protein RND81_02G117500 [Saponaria officinalis]|uniref:RING-type domain-containing protein n=1 Tax=Saponaria officinalis TaxID=3572 RepID=A0AAW1MM92_SAPOF
MIGNINLITTIIGFGMSSIFMVFICTRILCGRLRMAEPRRTFDTEPEPDIERPEQRTDALATLMVDAIPTMNYHRDAFDSTDDAQCSICLGEYQEEEVLRIMPKCGHSFHISCIDIWLMKQCTCPVCRLPVRDSFDRKHARSVSVSVSLSTDHVADTPTVHSGIQPSEPTGPPVRIPHPRF